MASRTRMTMIRIATMLIALLQSGIRVRPVHPREGRRSNFPIQKRRGRSRHAGRPSALLRAASGVIRTVVGPTAATATATAPRLDLLGHQAVGGRLRFDLDPHPLMESAEAGDAVEL